MLSKKFGDRGVPEDRMFYDLQGSHAALGCLIRIRLRLEQDANARLVAILGSDHQGGRAVGRCLIWGRLCLEQDVNARLAAILGR